MTEYLDIALRIITAVGFGFFFVRARYWKKTAKSLIDGELKKTMQNLGPILGRSFGESLGKSMAPLMVDKAAELYRDRLAFDGKLPASDMSWPDEIEDKDK